MFQKRSIQKYVWAVFLSTVASVACAEESVTPAVPVLSTRKKVGVMWMGRSSRPEHVTKNFMARMRELKPPIDIEYKISLPSKDGPKVYEEFLKTKDAIVFLRSSGATHMAKKPPQIPGFIGACSNPVKLECLEDLAHPSKNITGVTYYIPVEQQFALYKELLPNLKAVALLTEKGHDASPLDVADTKAACAKLGIEFFDASCDCKKYTDDELAKLPQEERAKISKEKIAQVVKSLRDKVDLFILGNQGRVFDKADMICNLAGKIPVFSYDQSPILKGLAVGGIVVDDEKLGTMLADSVMSALIEHKPISEIPVKVDTQPRLLISRNRAATLGLTLSENLKKTATFVDE